MQMYANVTAIKRLQMSSRENTPGPGWWEWGKGGERGVER